MRAVVFIAGFVLFAFALLAGRSHEARAQGVQLGACFHQTWALKTGSEPPGNFFFTAITSCSVPVQVLYEVTAAFQYNWDDGLWYPAGILGSDACCPTGTQFLGDSGLGDMPSYLGAACYVAVTGWTVQPYNWFPLYTSTSSYDPAAPNPCY